MSCRLLGQYDNTIKTWGRRGNRKRKKKKEKRQSVDPTLFVGVSRDPTHDLFTVLSGLCLCVGAAF